MDTIAAIATPQIPSAIGILRISGERTEKVLAALFTPAAPVETLAPRRMYYGTAHDAAGTVLDYVLAVRFSAGHSYTGEESAELHCHGSPVVLNEVLRAAFAAGARQALPGEFTKRAFLNGKLDLTEAEAVIDLIDAETAAAAQNAAAQLDGALRRPIERSYDRLLDLSSRFYAVVDYPDEDIEDLAHGEAEASLAAVEEELRVLLGSYARGRVLRTGVPTALLGAPNAGKSSLLNALVGYERAIVTDVAGTTRDTVEEKAVLGGVLLRLIDTAGLRESADAVEKLGVERAKRAAEAAELLFVLVDGSKAALSAEDREALALAANGGKPWVLVQTKRDLRAEELPIETNGAPRVCLSARTGEGLDALEAAVAALYPTGAQSATLLTNARQAEAVERALASVTAAREALKTGLTADVVVGEIERAQNALGELTGRTARADMVERIFERFCVGK